VHQHRKESGKHFLTPIKVAAIAGLSGRPRFPSKRSKISEVSFAAPHQAICPPLSLFKKEVLFTMELISPVLDLRISTINFKRGYRRKGELIRINIYCKKNNILMPVQLADACCTYLVFSFLFLFCV
jgi:hypothetical protein